MKQGTAMVACLVTVALSAACGGTAEHPDGVTYQPAAPTPQPAATPTPTAAPPIATPTPQPIAAATPPPEAAGAAGGPAPATPPPAMGNGSATPEPGASAGSGRTRRGTPSPTPDDESSDAAGSNASDTPSATPTSSFDAGSGVMQPDGKTIIYRIPDGTGGNDWNSKSEPIRVQRGMTLRLIDDDKSTKAGGHWLHTYGQPCKHGKNAIGAGYDCVIGEKAPLGIVSGVAEHNISNGIGHLYIEVVE